MEFKHWNTDGNCLWTAKEIMLKNKPHLVTFHESTLVSFWTFLLNFIFSIYTGDVFWYKIICKEKIENTKKKKKYNGKMVMSLISLKEIFKWISTSIGRHSWQNSRKWTQWTMFKSWLRTVYISLCFNALGKDIALVISLEGKRKTLPL